MGHRGGGGGGGESLATSTTTTTTEKAKASGYSHPAIVPSMAPQTAFTRTIIVKGYKATKRLQGYKKATRQTEPASHKASLLQARGVGDRDWVGFGGRGGE